MGLKYTYWRINRDIYQEIITRRNRYSKVRTKGRIKGNENKKRPREGIKRLP